jgi:hypothetical protein
VYNREADSYLGMSIKRSNDLSTIYISQKGLTENIVNAYLDLNSKPASSPAGAHMFDDNNNNNTIDKSNYLSAIMKIMYLARLTRPDILLATTYLSSRASAPTEGDWKKLLRIIRYLKGTTDYGIKISCKGLQLTISVDASYGSHSDGHSHTGAIVSIGENKSYLTAKSNKQKTIATSSTDAEVIGAVDTLKMAEWLQNLIQELDLEKSKPINLLQDNQSSIYMITEPSKYRRSKHILVKLLYARTLHKEGKITVQYIRTSDMTADMLTKPLQGEAFQKHLKSLGVVKIPK